MDQFVSCLKGKFDLLNYCGRSQVLLIIKNVHYELQSTWDAQKVVSFFGKHGDEEFIISFVSFVVNL